MIVDLPDEHVDLIFGRSDLSKPYTDGFKVDSEELVAYAAFQSETGGNHNE